MALTLALVALVTLVKCAVYSLMNINELDLITIKVDIDMGLLHPPFTQLKEALLRTDT